MDERSWRISEGVWWSFIGACAVGGLAGAGWALGWPGLIAGALVGAELTYLALLGLTTMDG